MHGMRALGIRSTKESLMTNLGQMLKQAQQMQSKMQEMQDQLAELEVTGTSGGGMCQVTLNGKGEARNIKIDPALVAPDDAEVLEDLILTAINDAKAKADEKMREQMQELTGGLPLPPGFQLPF
jgi:nucleoid-associated protein EbfC